MQRTVGVLGPTCVPCQHRPPGLEQVELQTQVSVGKPQGENSRPLFQGAAWGGRVFDRRLGPPVAQPRVAEADGCLGEGCEGDLTR